MKVKVKNNVVVIKISKQNYRFLHGMKVQHFQFINGKKQQLQLPTLEKFISRGGLH